MSDRNEDGSYNINLNSMHLEMKNLLNKARGIYNNPKTKSIKYEY